MKVNSKLALASKRQKLATLREKYLWRIEDNSNAPIIKNGDVVVIDPDVGELKEGSFYLIEGGERIALYKGLVETAEGGRYRFEDAGTESRMFEKNTARVMGRIIMVGREI